MRGRGARGITSVGGRSARRDNYHLREVSWICENDLAALRAEVAAWLASTGQTPVDLARGAKVGVRHITGLLDGGPIQHKRRLMLRRAMARAPKGFDGEAAMTRGPGGEARLAIDHDELQRRIEADQARLHGQRFKWLELEQQKYGLPKRGRLPEEMGV